MKTLLTTILALCTFTVTCSAQWTTSGTNIYNSNTGNVGIGTTTPTAGTVQIAAPDKETRSAIAIRQSNNSAFGFDFAVDQLVDGKGYLYGISAGRRMSLIQLDRTLNTVAFTGGNVGIGTTNPDQKLTVNGQVHSTSVVVTSTVPADYVFNNDYYLRPLADVKTYVDKNHHLPDVPAAAEFKKDGQNLGEMNMTLLKKVEELTLYLIEKDKQVKALQERQARLEKQVEQLINAKK